MIRLSSWLSFHIDAPLELNIRDSCKEALARIVSFFKKLQNGQDDAIPKSSKRRVSTKKVRKEEREGEFLSRLIPLIALGLVDETFERLVLLWLCKLHTYHPTLRTWLTWGFFKLANAPRRYSPETNLHSLRSDVVPNSLDLCPLIYPDDLKRETKERAGSLETYGGDKVVPLIEQHLDYILVEWIYTRDQEPRDSRIEMKDVLAFPIEWTFKMRKEGNARSNWLGQRWLRDMSMKVSNAMEQHQNDFCHRFQTPLVRALCVTAPHLLEGLAKRLEISTNSLVSTFFYLNVFFHFISIHQLSFTTTTTTTKLPILIAPFDLPFVISLFTGTKTLRGNICMQLRIQAFEHTSTLEENRFCGGMEATETKKSLKHSGQVLGSDEFSSNFCLATLWYTAV